MSSTSSVPAKSPRSSIVDDTRMRLLTVGIMIIVGSLVTYLFFQEDIVFSTRVGIVIVYIIGIPLLFASNYHSLKDTLMPSTPALSAEAPKLITVDDPKIRILSVGVIIAIGIAIAYLATQEDIVFSTRVAIIVGYVVGIPLLLSSNYDRSIMMMFFFGSIAGILKYKTGFNPIIHVTIDIMMVLICLGWLIRRMFMPRPTARVQTPLGKLIGVFVLICVIQLFNPLGYSYIAGIASLKMHIFMIPLFFFGYHYFRSISQFRNWCVAWVLIGLAMSYFTITQYQAGPEAMKAEMPEYTWMIDANTWQDSEGQYFFRPMSTTSNPGGASTWMQCIIPLTLAVIMFNRISKRLKIFLICALMVLLGTLFISLIRQMMMLTMGSIALIFLFQFLSGRLNRRIGGVLICLFIGVLGWQFAAGIAGTAVQENIDVLANPIDAFMKNRGYSYTYMDQVARSYPMGAGLGRTGPAAVKFRDDISIHYEKYGGPFMMPGENYFLVMLAETGIIGTIVICIIAFMFLRRGWQSYRVVEDNDLKWAAVAILAVLISIVGVFFGGPALVQAPLNLFFWFLAGVLLKIPVLDREIRENTIGSENRASTLAIKPDLTT